MRNGMIAILGVLAAGCSSSSPAPKASWEGGKLVAAEKSLAVKELTTRGEALKDQSVQVDGTVKRVCQGRGCWVEVADGDAAVIAKSLDHTVLFPKDCAGKRVLVQGVVRVNPPDQCEDHEEKKDHDCPKPTLLIEITGAQLF